MSFIPSTTIMNTEKLRNLVADYDRAIEEKKALSFEIDKLNLRRNALYDEIDKLTDRETDLTKEIEKLLLDLDEESKIYIVGSWVFTIGADRRLSVSKGTQM